MRALAVALLALLLAGPALAAPGSRITLSVSGEDLRSVLRTLAAKMDKNLYVHPAVQGKVTLDVKDMPVETALRLVLKMQPEPYGYKILDGTLVVAPRDRLAEIPDDILTP